MRKSPRRSVWRIFALAAVAAFACLAGLNAQNRPRGLLPDGADRPAVCGTRTLEDLRADAVAPTAIADGEPLFFDQEPPLISANYSGPVTLRYFNVAGDYATVQFRRYDPSDAAGRIETWTRVNSRSVDGRVVSVFEPTWPPAELSASLAHYRFGFDQPELYWGSLLMPNSDQSNERTVRLRMGIDGIPTSPVVRIDDRVQYSSNVVNLVVPGFGDDRVQGGQNAFEFSTATKLFYRYFEDAYDVIAIQPQANTMSAFAAFHRNVRNDVSGLNLVRFDQARDYGSGGVLQGVELYAGSTSARYQDTDHEMAHQWGSYFDWGRIAGISRAGHQPASHAPLWTGGETLLGAVLFGDRRVHAASDGYEIERTAPPARFHPIEMYSMGKIDVQAVPDFVVFSDQGQFSADTSSSPDPATHLAGDIVRVNINDVIRIHGPRLGPSPTTWRRATLVISRDELVSQREMDYWTFFAQRLADRAESNAATFGGYASFRTATQNSVELTTAIQPLNASGLPETLDTAAPHFGAEDLRGVAFTAPVGSAFAVGDTVTLNGRVTATDAVDFNQIAVQFYKVDGSDPIPFYGDVRRSGDFSVRIRFSAAQRGQYAMSVYLFWPGSGSQYPRSSLSTIDVR